MIDRQILADKLLEVLKEFDPDYRVEQRLRTATWASSSRSERVAVMGQRSTYCEVLARTPFYTSKRASNKTPNYNYDYEVNVWHEFKDAQDYGSSSQAKWDKIVASDEGVLISLADYGGESREGIYYYVDEPDSVSISEVPLDAEGKELAHYLTFNITVRRQT